MTLAHDWIRQAAQWQEAQQPFALVTVLRAQAPTSAKPGDKALVNADGQIQGWIGGGCAQPAVVKTVRLALADGQPRTIRIAPAAESAERSLDDVLEFGMACHSGGTLELFIDPVLPAATLLVVGDSPVARALAGLAPQVGLQVVALARGATAADFPQAARVLDDDAAARVREQVAAGGLAVVATQGRRDMQGLTAALAARPRALWFVASARKAQVLRESLVAAGEDAQAVAAIRAPAGEPIGAQTPEEVALSVLAAVVAERRRRAESPGAGPAVGHEAATVAASPAIETAPPQAAAPKSCCGSSARKPAVQAPPVPEPVTSAPRASCCGG